MSVATIKLPFVSARILLISDFNCPYCFTINEWLHRLGAGASVRWIGVEHRPDLPLRGENRTHDLNTLGREVADVQHRAPEVGVVRPSFWTNSRDALLVQNAIEDEEPSRAFALRRLLFQSYWIEGQSLSFDLIREKVKDLNLQLPEVEPEYLEDLTDWWRQEVDRIPCMLSPTGVAHLGLQDFISVKAFINSTLREGRAGPGCR